MINCKKRPSLIIKSPKGEDLIVLQITGNSYEKEVEVPIKNNDFIEGGLKRDSYIRIDKIVTIKRSRIKYKIGSLKKEKFKEIVEEFIEFIKQ